MPDVWSIMIWLKGSDSLPGNAQAAQSVAEQRERDKRPEGYRTRVFNPPALERVQYNNYETHEEAERALQDLTQRLSDARPITVNNAEGVTFVIPADSVHYIAMGKGRAGRVRPSPHDTPA